jgi:hypothetical protein
MLANIASYRCLGRSVVPLVGPYSDPFPLLFRWGKRTKICFLGLERANDRLLGSKITYNQDLEIANKT